jgi:hypothetical protein
MFFALLSLSAGDSKETCAFCQLDSEIWQIKNLAALQYFSGKRDLVRRNCRRKRAPVPAVIPARFPVVARKAAWDRIAPTQADESRTRAAAMPWLA